MIQLLSHSRRIDRAGRLATAELAAQARAEANRRAPARTRTADGTAAFDWSGVNLAELLRRGRRELREAREKLLAEGAAQRAREARERGDAGDGLSEEAGHRPGEGADASTGTGTGDGHRPLFPPEPPPRYEITIRHGMQAVVDTRTGLLCDGATTMAVLAGQKPP